jgi:hypothetical protein
VPVKLADAATARLVLLAKHALETVVRFAEY